MKNSNREISRSCGIESSTVSDYLQRAKRAEIEWPPPEGLTEQVLEEALFPPPPATGTERMILDFTEVHKELKSKKHVTLNLLWQEYKEHPLRGINIAGFVSIIASGQASLIWQCSMGTGPERSYLLITPDRLLIS